MSFTANPLSLSVPDPAFESWLRDSGYLEILDERTTTLHHNQNKKPPPLSTSTTTTATINTTIITPTANYMLSNFKTIFSLFTINPFSKLTSDDFSNETPSWTVGFIGYSESYSFPSSPSQARLRVHENVKRYCRNYAALFLLVFACTLYQMPVSLFGLIACLVLWELFKWCGEKAGWTQYPSVQQSLIHLVQCGQSIPAVNLVGDAEIEVQQEDKLKELQIELQELKQEWEDEPQRLLREDEFEKMIKHQINGSYTRLTYLSPVIEDWDTF